MKKIILTILSLFCSQILLFGHLFTENFDGQNINYEWTISGCNWGDMSDYADILPDSEIDQIYTNADGDFLAVQDTDGEGCTQGACSVVASIETINTYGVIGMTVCFDIAEGDAADGGEDWDAYTNVIFSASVDNGTSQYIQFSSGGMDDSEPGLDSNCDGVADGGLTPFSPLTPTFTTYCIDLPDSGATSTLDMSFTFNGLDANDKDVAIDNIVVYYTQSANGNPDADFPPVASVVTCDATSLPSTTCATCSDGIQNGDEEGVDCGGPDCPILCANNNCTSAGRFADPNQARIASQLGTFIQDELSGNFIAAEAAYIRHISEIQGILESEETRYETVNQHFDQLKEMLLSLLSSAFISETQANVTTQDLMVLDDFLASLYAVTNNRDLSGEIETIRTHASVMEGKSMKDALIAFDRAVTANLKLIPNLVDSQMSIIYDVETITDVQFQIIDTKGRMVKEYSKSADDLSELRVDVSDLQAGYYFVKMVSGNLVLTEKFIKQ